MKKTMLSLFVLSISLFATAQKTMTPEMLIQLGKLSAMGSSTDGKSIIYGVKTYSLAEGKSTTKFYSVPVAGGNAAEINDPEKLILNNRISSAKTHSIASYDVKVKKIFGKEVYPDLPKSDVMIYDNL